METGIITYNLRDRGRQHSGFSRNFDTAAIARVINGAACQERVKNRDCLGYYGHWPRVKYGWRPQEGGIDKGKPSFVEPAIVTTFLEADPDGTIRHNEEFLGTDSGQVAAKLFMSRAGGFSSAIDNIKPEFFGFDFVLEPNFSTNRGYTLDDANGMSLDDVDAAIYNEQARGMMILLDSVTRERDLSSRTIESLKAENEELLSLLVKKGVEKPEIFLDAIHPFTVEIAAKDRLLRGAELFNRMEVLPGTEQPSEEPKMPSFYHRLLNRF